MDDEWLAFQQRKCSICGGWKKFGDLWINMDRGLCPGHSDLEEQYEALREAYRRCPGPEIITFAAQTPPYKVDRQGNRLIDPDYIAPALRAEPIQYEQALVGYELLIEKGMLAKI